MKNDANEKTMIINPKKNKNTQKGKNNHNTLSGFK